MDTPIVIAKIEGFEISLETSVRKDRAPQYAVHYGQHVKRGMDYHSAAKEIGLCVLHALAANGDITLED